MQKLAHQLDPLLSDHDHCLQSLTSLCVHTMLHTCCGPCCTLLCVIMSRCAAGSSYAGVPLSGGCNSSAGCSSAGGVNAAVAHQAEVMVVGQGGSQGQLPGTAGGGQGPWVSSASAAAGAHSHTGRSNGGQGSSGHAGVQGGGGSGGGGVGGGVRVGRPAVGPWCTSYSTTFVQQEAFKGMMREFQEAALQRQQGR